MSIEAEGPGAGQTDDLAKAIVAAAKVLAQHPALTGFVIVVQTERDGRRFHRASCWHKDGLPEGVALAQKGAVILRTDSRDHRWSERRG